GGLLIGVAEHLGEDQCFATFGGELVDKRAHIDPLGPDGGVGGVGGSGVLVFDVGFSGACHVVADVVHPDAPGEGAQPGAGGGACGEAGECSHDTQVGLLGEIIGDLPATEVGKQPPDVILGFADEFGEGVTVPTSGG